MTYLGPKVVGNFKPPKNPNKKREPKARDRRPGMSEKHLKLIRQLPSCVSGKRPCVAHHLQVKNERGASLKATDRWAVPLTNEEHLLDKDCVHSVGTRQELKWFKDRGIKNPYELASALWSASPNLETMRRIIAAHAKPSKPKRPKKCVECGVNYADPPSDICVGCEAYKEHTAF